MASSLIWIGHAGTRKSIEECSVVIEAARNLRLTFLCACDFVTCVSMPLNGAQQPA